MYPWKLSLMLCQRAGLCPWPWHSCSSSNKPRDSYSLETKNPTLMCGDVGEEGGSGIMQELHAGGRRATHLGIRMCETSAWTPTCRTFWFIHPIVRTWRVKANSALLHPVFLDGISLAVATLWRWFNLSLKESYESKQAVVSMQAVLSWSEGRRGTRFERMTYFKSFGNCLAVAEEEKGQVSEACRTTPEQMPSNAPGQDPTSQSIKLG